MAVYGSVARANVPARSARTVTQAKKAAKNRVKDPADEDGPGKDPKKDPAGDPADDPVNERLRFFMEKTPKCQIQVFEDLINK